MAKNDNGVPHAIDQMKDALAESGQAVAAQAGEIKDQALGAAMMASEKASEAAHALSAQMPASAQEWELLAKELTDSIRKNPRPWLIGAAVAGLMFLLGRRTAR
jgi:hypothetical protein